MSSEKEKEEESFKAFIYIFTVLNIMLYCDPEGVNQVKQWLN